MSRGKIALAALGAGLLVALASWLYLNFERVPVQVETGPRGAARTDTLLAAKRLFRALNAQVLFLPGYRGLPPRNGTLVLLVPEALAEDQMGDVARWVREGGHVIVLIEADAEPFRNLSMLPLEIGEVSLPATTAEVSLARDVRLRVSFGPGNGLELPAKPAAEVTAAQRMAVFAQGKGLLTVTTDSHFLRNEGIGDEDNAVFLWTLTHLDRSGPIWFVTGRSPLSPWQPLMERSWPLLIALAVALLAFAWTRCARFGPLLTEDAATTPRIVDHVRASGRFFWRMGASGALLDDMRHELLQQLDKTRPGWLAADDRDQRIAALCELSPEEVAFALAGDPGKHKPTYTRAIAALEQIRKQL